MSLFKKKREPYYVNILAKGKLGFTGRHNGYGNMIAVWVDFEVEHNIPDEPFGFRMRPNCEIFEKLTGFDHELKLNSFVRKLNLYEIVDSRDEGLILMDKHVEKVRNFLHEDQKDLTEEYDLGVVISAREVQGER